MCTHLSLVALAAWYHYYKCNKCINTTLIFRIKPRSTISQTQYLYFVYNVLLLLQEVCSQIWATLYDYPGLKTCDGLIKYIKECVRTAWGLTNQVRQKSLFITIAFHLPSWCFWLRQEFKEWQSLSVRPFCDKSSTLTWVLFFLKMI